METSSSPSPARRSGNGLVRASKEPGEDVSDAMAHVPDQDKNTAARQNTRPARFPIFLLKIFRLFSGIF